KRTLHFSSCVLSLAFCLLRFDSCVLVLRFGLAFSLFEDLSCVLLRRDYAQLETPLRFVSKASCVLLKDSLRFASSQVAFCFKLSCVLLQDKLRFATRFVAFCFKSSCVLLQVKLRFASRQVAFCYKTSCVLFKTLAGPYKPTIVLVQAVAATDDSPAIPEQTTVETPMNMSPENKAHFQAEKEAIHLILTGIEMKYTRLLMLAKLLRKCGKLSKGYNKRDKDMQKNLALIAKYFKKIYKLTTNNLRTSSNSRNKNVDTTSRYKNDNQSGQFRNQRTMNVAEAKQNECRKPKRVKDSAYHKEKILLCKQAEKGVPLQAEQYDWLQDTNEEIDEQELKAHYSYRVKIQEQEMHADLKYVESLEKELDELESDKAELSNMYDMIFPLMDNLTIRQIHRAGFFISFKVADTVSNSEWNCLYEWNDKFPNATFPFINLHTTDVLFWSDRNGVYKDYSVGVSWNDLRPRKDEVVWSKCLSLLYIDNVMAKLVMAKLVLAALVYVIWQERNTIIFKKKKRTKDQEVAEEDAFLSLQHQCGVCVNYSYFGGWGECNHETDQYRNKWENDDFVCRGLILNDFKHSLKHKKDELTLIGLGNHLPIEEALMVQDSDKPKSKNVASPSVVNMVEHNSFIRYNDNKDKRKHQADTKADPNNKSKLTC
nr:zinc finger, CCHC-type [Tanacetum cinerariifolium]